jgi:hypothetical protein
MPRKGMLEGLGYMGPRSRSVAWPALFWKVGWWVRCCATVISAVMGVMNIVVRLVIDDLFRGGDLEGVLPSGRYVLSLNEPCRITPHVSGYLMASGKMKW